MNIFLGVVVLLVAAVVRWKQYSWLSVLEYVFLALVFSISNWNVDFSIFHALKVWTSLLFFIGEVYFSGSGSRITKSSSSSSKMRFIKPNRGRKKVALDKRPYHWVPQTEDAMFLDLPHPMFFFSCAAFNLDVGQNMIRLHSRPGGKCAASGISVTCSKLYSYKYLSYSCALLHRPALMARMIGTYMSLKTAQMWGESNIRMEADMLMDFRLFFSVLANLLHIVVISFDIANLKVDRLEDSTALWYKFAVLLLIVWLYQLLAAESATQ
jgi:hypothetical protein